MAVEKTQEKNAEKKSDLDKPIEKGITKQQDLNKGENSLNKLWDQYMHHEIKTSKFLNSVGALYGLRV